MYWQGVSASRQNIAEDVEVAALVGLGCWVAERMQWEDSAPNQFTYENTVNAAAT